MNAIQVFMAQAWIERLGFTLLHFLWEGIVIAAIYAVARRGARRPGVRYALGCAALASMACAPVVTWTLLGPVHTAAAEVSSTVPVSAGATATVHMVSQSFAFGTYRATPAPFLPWVVGIWATGALLFWLRLAGGWIFAERLRFRGVRAAAAEWQQVFERLKTSIGVSRPVRLLVSALV